MGITKITRNYQITLPADVREVINLKIGDKLLCEEEEGKIIIKKVEKKAIVEQTSGAWKSKGSGIGYVREMRKRDEERFKRLDI